MRLPLLLLFVLVIRSAKSGQLEDAKDLISSFKSVVDIPVSKEFKKARLFMSFSKSFLKRAAPFGELFATALKVGLEEDQLEILLNVTNGISEKITDISKLQTYIETSIIYRDLLINYRSKVDKPIGALLGQIERMSHMKMEVPHAVVNAFVSSCVSLNGPYTIAQFLATLVNDCDKPELPPAATTQLFNLINNAQYVDYKMSEDDQKLFFQRFSVLYFWLSSRLDKLPVLVKFGKNQSGFSFRNKAVLLSLLMEELGISDADKTETMCLPKAAFVTHGYKRNTIDRFADLLMAQMTSLEFVTVMCANLTYYGYPEKANYYTLQVGRKLEPVYQFVGNWFESLLENTWPDTESLLIRNIMQDASKGALFPETNETYAQIADLVHEKMRGIGSRDYRRQYVATKERAAGFLSKDFTFNCKPRSCEISSTMGAHVISIRTRTDTNEVYESLQQLINFRNESWPTYFKALDERLYSYLYIEKVVALLADDYGLDFNQFSRHSSYVLLRRRVHPAGCSSTFAVKSDEDLDNSFLQFLHYHEDGTWFTNCQDWLVILGF